MATPRRYELDELSNRPGAYFNPQTEVLLIVDDSPDVDHEIFETESDADGWVLISDETPVDEHRRDELIESFQVTYHPSGELVAPDVGEDEDDDDDENDELEPDIDPELGPE